MPNRLPNNDQITMAMKFFTAALFSACISACDNTVVSEGNGEYSLSADAEQGESSGNIIDSLKLKAQEYCKGKGSMEYLASTGTDSPGTPSATVYFTCKINTGTQLK